MAHHEKSLLVPMTPHAAAELEILYGELQVVSLYRCCSEVVFRDL
jgi:hypothetical protein